MDELTDAERESLARLKLAARQREPLSETYADSVPDEVAAACELLAGHLLEHPQSATTWAIGNVVGDQLVDLALAMWSVASVARDRRVQEGGDQPI